jgi:hypothetical protein
LNPIISIPKERFQEPKFDLLVFLDQYAFIKDKVLPVLQRIGFVNSLGIKKIPHQLVVDFSLPMSVGGYWNLKDTIGVNPAVLLFGDEKEIAHVLIHEGFHAPQVYTEAGIQDEALTENLAKERMNELYGSEGIATGYDREVEFFAKTFPSMTFEDIIDLVEKEDDLDTLDNLIEWLILNSNRELQPEDFSYHQIHRRIEGIWETLQELFPRLMNAIYREHRGPHEEANVPIYEYKIEGILEKVAYFLSDNPETLQVILNKLLSNFQGQLTYNEVEKAFIEAGYGYFIDFSRITFSREVNEFIKNKNNSDIFGRPNNWEDELALVA